MYDRGTDSLWSQLGMKAVAGRRTGEALKVVRAEYTSWQDWLARYPDTTVLSFETGYRRDYNGDPYQDMQLNRQEAVAVMAGGQVVLYPFSELGRTAGAVEDVVGGIKLSLRYDRRTKALQVAAPEGQSVSHFVAFLADLRIFYPQARLFKRPANR